METRRLRRALLAATASVMMACAGAAIAQDGNGNGQGQGGGNGNTGDSGGGSGESGGGSGDSGGGDSGGDSGGGGSDSGGDSGGGSDSGGDSGGGSDSGGGGGTGQGDNGGGAGEGDGGSADEGEGSAGDGVGVGSGGTSGGGAAGGGPAVGSGSAPGEPTLEPGGSSPFDPSERDSNTVHQQVTASLPPLAEWSLAEFYGKPVQGRAGDGIGVVEGVATDPGNNLYLITALDTENVDGRERMIRLSQFEVDPQSETLVLTDSAVELLSRMAVFSDVAPAFTIVDDDAKLQSLLAAE